MKTRKELKEEAKRAHREARRATYAPKSTLTEFEKLQRMMKVSQTNRILSTLEPMGQIVTDPLNDNDPESYMTISAIKAGVMGPFMLAQPSF